MKPKHFIGFSFYCGILKQILILLGNQKLLLSDNVSHEMFSRVMQCITLLYINSLSLPKRMLCLYSMPTRSEMVRKQCYRAILKRFHFHVHLLSCVSFCVYLRKSHYRLSWQYAREIFPLRFLFSLVQPIDHWFPILQQ